MACDPGEKFVQDAFFVFLAAEVGTTASTVCEVARVGLDPAVIGPPDFFAVPELSSDADTGVVLLLGPAGL